MLYYEATAGCGVWGVGGLGAHRPVSLTLGRAAVWPRSPRCPSAPIRYSSYANWPHPYPLLCCPSSALIVIYIPYSHPSRLPRPRSPRSSDLGVCLFRRTMHRTRRSCLPLVAPVLHTPPSHFLSVRNSLFLRPALATLSSRGYTAVLSVFTMVFTNKWKCKWQGSLLVVACF